MTHALLDQPFNRRSRRSDQAMVPSFLGCAPWLALIALATPAFAEQGSLGDSFAHQPFYLMGGIARLSHAGARELTSENGIHGGFGYVSGDQGVIGCAGIDLDWRHALGGSSRIDSVSTCYTERAYGLFGDGYIGYGVGSAFNRVELHEPTYNIKDRGWKIAAKVMGGYAIGAGMFIEGAWFYSGKTGGLDTSGFTLSAGIWF